jgi:hypothetical protein
MNPVQEEIHSRLSVLPPDLTLVRELGTRHARFCSSISTDDTLQLGHQPWVAPEGYAVRLFAPAKKAWFARFRERTGKVIPSSYQTALSVMNGCHIYGLSLFGLPPSKYATTSVLDRTRVQPLDLESANTHWMREYQVEETEFHFGSRSWTVDENIGYFWNKLGCRALRKSGECVGTWRDLPALLASELPEAERLGATATPAVWS